MLLRIPRWTPLPAVQQLTAVTFLLVLLSTNADAQYFGRNKVQYETFDFRVLATENFDIHYYPAESVATHDAARMAERWNSRLQRGFAYRLSQRKPLIFYANHPDFQQTNVVGGFINQGTGGLTEGLRNRVAMPYTGSYADNHHVLGHELVHVYQYDMAGTPEGGGLVGLNRLPLWLIEGMAEYLSVGRADPHTAMWLRDATLRDDLPTIAQLTTDPRFFPYRYGQALWAYIGGEWGDESVARVFKGSLRAGFDIAVQRGLGVTVDTLSARWKAAIRSTYLPTLQGKMLPENAGEQIVTSGAEGEMNISPVVSPDGRRFAFFSSRGLFTVDLYLADARTGRVIRKLASPATDAHFDALSFINSAGSWSPDGRRFAFIVFAEGDNQIAILDVESGDIERRIKPSGVGAITDVAWSPDGRHIAFSGSAGGISDLYVYDLESNSSRQLTDDRYADLHVAWSPDGRTIAFVTDRGSATDFERLTFGPMRLALLDVEARAIRLLPMFEGAKHINPQFSPDGSDLYFISDRGGFSDIYRLSLATQEVFQVTEMATGVSGITPTSPALSVASDNGRVLFSVFHKGGYGIYARTPEQARGKPVEPINERAAVAGVLPPVGARGEGLVYAYLNDPLVGLPPSDRDFEVEDYSPGLGLTYLGPPTVGVGVSSVGTAVVGGVSGYFTDLLGNRAVGAAVQASGTLKDIGGQVVFQNLSRRWNWGVGVAHIPYLTGFTRVRDTSLTANGQTFPAVQLEQLRQRIFIDEIGLSTQYPFSQTRRIEFQGAFRRLSYDFELQRIIGVGNQIVSDRTTDIDSPSALNFFQGSAAFVGDYSFFGFTSPLQGGRYRFEVAPTVGDLNFVTALADWRRYFFARPFTLAFRGLHFGRYGGDAEDERLTPLFLGYPTLIRGYDFDSFKASECTVVPGNVDRCPEFNRLVGSRIGVASAELRIPLFGSEQLGLISVPFLPIELAPFFDAGVAWTSDADPELRFDRRSTERVPVFSTGLSARLNVLGYLVAELFYVYPFQRPEEGWHFGFNIAPGW